MQGNANSPGTGNASSSSSQPEPASQPASPQSPSSNKSAGAGWTFLKQFRDNFRTTGAIAPSSRYLAKAISSRIAGEPGTRRILEVGPGTGPFTDLLIKSLAPGDQLVLVELNDEFVAHLRSRLDSDPTWSCCRGQVHLQHCSVLDMENLGPYHGIVCGLPFNNFEPELVESLLATLIEHLAPGGVFSFFEYLAIRELAAPFVGSEKRTHQAAIAKVLDRYLTQYHCGSDRVFWNLPPAVAHHLRKPAG